MAVVVRQVLDVNAINRQLHGPTGGVARDLLRRGLRVQTAAKRLCPVDTGRLRSAIELASRTTSVYGVSTVSIIVGTNVEYARYVHDGTGIFGVHGTPIVPRHGTFLVFKSRRTGKMVFARSVRGQRGVPFLKKALSAAA